MAISKSSMNRKFHGMRASKGVLSLLWVSNEYGTKRGFSAYTLSEFCGLGHKSTRELLARLVKRGILTHDEKMDLYTLREERTILSGRDGLPYETGILQQMRKDAADAKLAKGV